MPEPHTDVQYRLGSISKTVTAVAVLRLRDEGRLTLDDPLELHVPGTPVGERTVGQLLAHLGGAAAESGGTGGTSSTAPGPAGMPGYPGATARASTVRGRTMGRFGVSPTGIGVTA